MRKALLVIAGMLAAFAAGEQFGLYLRRPIEVPGVVVMGPKPTLDEGEAGAINGDDGSCDLPWVICWRRT